MCGRYNFSSEASDEKITALIEMMDRKYPGQYKTGEIFPGDTAPVIIRNKSKIVPVPAVFGFPGFQDGKLLINARSETAAQKKAFSDCLRDRRAIIPAMGFYEWSHDSARTKYLFTVDAASVLYLCGLYKLIEGSYRFVVLTRQANETMIETHDRMPVIIGEEKVRDYLTDFEDALALISSASPALIRSNA